ncbi:3-ketoacyl-CoA thiolase A, peroxisomal-like isoform X2 [Physella acuta]|uniref:3-ketoacyl-CoA thiolase A, peroxisomal-like isoform X1 n=1 Tax=Physella acuta TaxID=109671 RepID=UPI0027DAF08C|nr:3-ketoacyl-CoA thiolase A, peroxisomal-like isoform X1 [Physella acuta]XP_059176749.1 3-ketoacyl-CoA thiolase A, peroxisomal-like isoform X2 [Physella acuta]XP_059176752.1 3-ketoacyl-CoA thiolase A, peroxisomal-like isoform X3 [Physella acuta]XP_059176758.1 3-ketoacyl-CoA thiolase A, peroxisomal-like isoform X4 [Physella acuta]XP_059176767.1 3-ketoacyl-CoA thiolase A, peroxisomal-like isoform X5 [Physella acuta]XP_059176775.1 3-ketoacyl-CoA thiolase A, peroxisomal-like isoform X2 [Physella 
MAHRLHTLKGHLGSSLALKPCSQSDKPEDVVIVSALRTPIGKAKRGSFKDTHGDELLAAVFKAVLDETKINPSELGDICVGNVQDPQSLLTVRLAQFYCGIPEDVPAYTTNRACSSGLVALANVAGNIRNGVYRIGLAGGVESMSTYDMGKNKNISLNPRVADLQKTLDLLLPMGITSENVAERFGISRQKQDEFALSSQTKALKAAEGGLFDAEIVPVTTKILDENGQEKILTVRKDDGIRATTIEGLSKLRPAFKENGSTTAGNSSQVSDGAAAVLMMTRDEAQRRKLPILGIFRSFAVKGCPPDVMGIGPAVAIPLALEKAGLTVQDIDVFEINEAFASQAVYCVEKLNIPANRVNPKGGAIALGHPLGCTGARQVATLLHELKRRGQRAYGVVSMCIGTGMGAAAVLEYPGST